MARVTPGPAQADAELAWSNCVKGVRVFRHEWNGFNRFSEKREHYHPAQKPVALMRWCIQKAGMPAVICDPYMGGGPIPRASKDLGLSCIGIDIEERYCEIAAKRLAQEVMAL